MKVHRISPSHRPELVFEGSCISTASGDPDDKVAPGRWHEILVYRRSDDAWVVGIRYRTRCPDEQEHTEAEVVDNASEIESLLLSYEPWDHLNRRTLASDERKRVSKRIWTKYLDLVDRVLEDIAPHLSAPVSDTGTST
jgi:hypothetical protein